MSETSTNTVKKYVKPSEAAAPQFFPAEHQDALAVVMFPRSFNRNGTSGKSEALCTILVFGAESDLDAGQPSKIFYDAIVSAGVIYKQLGRVHQDNSPLIGYIGQGAETSFGTLPWVVKDLDIETEARVLAIWEGIVA